MAFGRRQGHRVASRVSEATASFYLQPCTGSPGPHLHWNHIAPSTPNQIFAHASTNQKFVFRHIWMCRGLRTVRTSTSSPFRSAIGSFCYRAATGHRLRMEICDSTPCPARALRSPPYNWLLLRPRLWHKTCCFYKAFRLISLLPRDTRLCSHRPNYVTEDKRRAPRRVCGGPSHMSAGMSRPPRTLLPSSPLPRRRMHLPVYRRQATQA